MTVRGVSTSKRRVLRRVLTWAAMLALLGHVLTGAPAMLQMAAMAGAVPAGEAHVASQDGVPCHQHHRDGAPLRDHEHCLLCHGGIGLFVLAGPPLFWAPISGPADSSTAGRLHLAAGLSATAYTSRGPPAIL
jgi:hypothetical protein